MSSQVLTSLHSIYSEDQTNSYLGSLAQAHHNQGDSDVASASSALCESHTEERFFTPTHELEELGKLDFQLSNTFVVDLKSALQASAQKMPEPADLTLHSPSEIIGTPFATSSTRFEYPFPDSSSSQSSPEPLFQQSPTLPPLTTSISSVSLTSTTSNHSFSLPQDLPSFSHPKLRSSRDPPIPPGLARKRHRWSLALTGRRRSNAGSFDSDRSDEGSIRSLFSTESFKEGCAKGEEIEKEPTRESGVPIQV
jgi:hypothetical protein